MSTWSTSSRPSSPKEGEFGLNITTSNLEIWDGYNWITK
jgi:hypothetical protein